MIEPVKKELKSTIQGNKDLILNVFLVATACASLLVVRKRILGE